MAVLRHEPLRDVHVRHDFDARDQRGMKVLWRRRLFLQQSVYAVAQLQRLLKRQYMNVARTFPQRGGYDQVDQVHHRRLVGHHFDVVRAFLRRRPGGLRVEILDHLLDRHLAGFGDLLQQFRRFHRLFLHFQSRQQPDVIYHPLVARLGRGDDDDARRLF